ncbi:hypothetical protein CPA50_17735 [Marinobacter sp. ANT_B65]|nr:hypothetical protein CPA50_17735 [Marinobacter sp. ANT_B65]
MITTRPAIRNTATTLFRRFSVLAESFQHQNNSYTEHQPGMAAMEDQFRFTGTSKQGDPKKGAEKSQQCDRKTRSGRRG